MKKFLILSILLLLNKLSISQNNPQCYINCSANRGSNLQVLLEARDQEDCEAQAKKICPYKKNNLVIYPWAIYPHIIEDFN